MIQKKSPLEGDFGFRPPGPQHFKNVKPTRKLFGHIFNIYENEPILMALFISRPIYQPVQYAIALRAFGARRCKSIAGPRRENVRIWEYLEK